MITLTVAEFHAKLKEQGVPSKEDLAFSCPMCGTVQSGRDLIAAGAGANFEEVEKYLAFSCIGRFTHGKSPPSAKDKGTQQGCNWTLGGLFGIADLTVVDEDGGKHLRFMPCTPEIAQLHAQRPTAA